MNDEDLRCFSVKTRILADDTGLHVTTDILYRDDLSRGVANGLHEEIERHGAENTFDSILSSDLIDIQRYGDGGLYAIESANDNRKPENGYKGCYELKFYPYEVPSDAAK
jgi:hypothetical protein